jgi:hypothetical protein
LSSMGFLELTQHQEVKNKPQLALGSIVLWSY